MNLLECRLLLFLKLRGRSLIVSGVAPRRRPETENGAKEHIVSQVCRGLRHLRRSANNYSVRGDGGEEGKRVSKAFCLPEKTFSLFAPAMPTCNLLISVLLVTFAKTVIMIILNSPISRATLKDYAANTFGDMIKCVADIDKKFITE